MPRLKEFPVLRARSKLRPIFLPILLIDVLRSASRKMPVHGVTTFASRCPLTYFSYHSAPSTVKCSWMILP